MSCDKHLEAFLDELLPDCQIELRQRAEIRLNRDLSPEEHKALAEYFRKRHPGPGWQLSFFNMDLIYYQGRFYVEFRQDRGRTLGPDCQPDHVIE